MLHLLGNTCAINAMSGEFGAVTIGGDAVHEEQAQ